MLSGRSHPKKEGEVRNYGAFCLRRLQTGSQSTSRSIWRNWSVNCSQRPMWGGLPRCAHELWRLPCAIGLLIDIHTVSD